MEELKAMAKTDARYNNISSKAIKEHGGKEFTFNPKKKSGQGRAKINNKIDLAPEKTAVLKNIYNPQPHIEFANTLKNDMLNMRSKVDPVVNTMIENNKHRRALDRSKFYKTSSCIIGLIGIFGFLGGAWPVALIMGGILAGGFVLRKLGNFFLGKIVDAFRNRIAATFIKDEYSVDRHRMSALERCSFAMDKASRILKSHNRKFKKCKNFESMTESIHDKHKKLEKVTKTLDKEITRIAKLAAKTKNKVEKSELLDTYNYLTAALKSIDSIKTTDLELISESNIKKELEKVALAEIAKTMETQNINQTNKTNNLEQNTKTEQNIDERLINQQSNALVDDLIKESIQEDKEKATIKEKPQVEETVIKDVFNMLTQDEEVIINNQVDQNIAQTTSSVHPVKEMNDEGMER